MDKMLLPFLEAHLGRYERTLTRCYESQGGMPPYVGSVVHAARLCKSEQQAERFLCYFYSTFLHKSKMRRALAGSSDALHCELVALMLAILNIFRDKGVEV